MFKALSLLTAVMCAGFCSCSQEEPTVAAANTDSARCLVVCYSWSGNTRTVAQIIADDLHAPFVELKPVTPYPTKYQECVDQAKKEISAGFKAPLSTEIDVSAYDLIFVGSPNWWGTMAPPVAAFLSDSALKGKTIVPFFTHGGGGMQQCEKDVAKWSKEATILKAETFRDSSIQSNKGAIIDFARNSVKAAELK